MVPIARLWVLVAALAATAAAGAPYRRGPVVLDQLPPGAAKDLGTVGASAAVKGNWPPEFLERVRGQLRAGGGVLLVGRTDASGPRTLNRSLGFQYAAEAARRLAASLGAEPWRFACASLGEEGNARGTPGVTAYPWSPAALETEEARPVTLLEPAGPQSPRSLLWGFWEPAATRALWTLGSGEGEVAWSLDPALLPVRLPFPARGGPTALGVSLPGRGPVVVRADQPSANEDRRLALRVQTQGSWSALLEGRLPDRWTEPIVWVGGVPYPVVPMPNGRFELEVALLPSGNRAYVQATDPAGRVFVGPGLPLSDGEGKRPALVAVLIWEQGEADLDLHAWSGERHTDPQDPDDAFSAGAVPGTRLLFDGDGGSPVSALVATDSRSLEIAGECYSDLGGTGTTAWLYVISHPGDPLRESRRVLGPRRLSAAALETRWPALRWEGD